jgi:hypothetical protein
MVASPPMPHITQQPQLMAPIIAPQQMMQQPMSMQQPSPAFQYNNSSPFGGRFGRRGGGRSVRGARGGGRARQGGTFFPQPQQQPFAPPQAILQAYNPTQTPIVANAYATANRRTAPAYSNIVKRYANMNVCFSCGFDVEDGHSSSTCPQQWHRPNHQVGFTRANAQQYINAGYDACTRAMHKTQYPAM